MNNIDPRDSESKLISSIIQSGEIHVLQSKGIRSDDLLIFGEVLEFIFEHDKKYKKLPDIETVTLAFSDFPVYSGNSLDLDFLLDVTIENAKKKKLREIISRGIDVIEESPSKAVSFLLDKIPEIESRSETRVVFADSDPDARVRKYALKKQMLESGKKVGLRTGISVLDEELLGWLPGDLILIIGPPGSGKSGLAMRSSVVNYIAGERILYLSLEMPEEEQTLRFHTIAGREYGFSFSNMGLMTGRGIDQDEYLSFLKRLEGRKDFVIVDDIEGGKFTVAKIEGLVRELSPGVVVIDSMPVLTASDGSSAISWTGLLDVAWGLKYLAIRTGVVVIAIAGTEASTFESTRPATKDEVGLSKNITYAIDIGISLAKSKKDNYKNMMIMKRRKGREESDVFQIPFDIEHGRIG